MKKSIGIIGVGVVGKAMLDAFKDSFDVLTYDQNKKEISNIDDPNPIREMVFLVDGPIFVCVPTPSNDDGSCNTRIVEDVCYQINEAQQKKTTEQSCYCNCCGISEQVVVIRSTVKPGTCDDLKEKFPYLEIVYNPEFLTERTASSDFKNTMNVIMGGEEKIVEFVGYYYKSVLKHAHVYQSKYIIAEILKYASNSFFALKIIFANQLKSYCDSVHADYEQLKNLMFAESRFGLFHWDVPGHDGFLGYGGKCLPKDSIAFLTDAKIRNVDFSILEEAIRINKKIRRGE